MLRLEECVGRPEVGAKTERLARVREAGLPTLDGVVLLPDDPVGEIALEGDRFIVRSSSSVEDRAGASSAGVFESVRNVTRDGITAAVESVRASANGAAARSYFGDAAISMAVLIQPMASAKKLAVAMSGERGFLVEERAAAEPEWGDVEARTVETGPLFELLKRLEALVGGPIDAELALDPEITVLQVRPRSRGSLEAVDDAFRRFGEPGRWKLDAEHNPQPLSAAQAGLVALVEELQVGPRQRVIAGWLFVESGAPPRNLAPLPLADLRRRFDEGVAPDCRRKFAAASDLESALGAFAHLYKRYVGEVSPSISRAKAQLDQLLRMNLGEPLSQHGNLLGGIGGAALRRDQALWEVGRDPSRLLPYFTDFGAWSPAWDVAVPPDDESPSRVEAAARAFTEEPRIKHDVAVAAADHAAHELLERLDRMSRRAFKALLPTVRSAMEVGEDDDALFFEAQRLVRRALLSLSIPDVFDIPLDAVRNNNGDWARLAAEGRAAREAAARITPPSLIHDGQPHHLLPSEKRVLRGHATSGQARGRAFRGGDQVPDDAVLVVPALLPSLAYLLPRCRALVTAHGGATSHGATLAREYGIPAVLGARGADSIPDGAELFVDGSAGRVLLL
jgi:phosphohistidine swiveling domain-containing protein